MTDRADADVQARRRTLIEILYRKYHGALLRFLNRQCVGRDDAAEIAQEAYCRMQQAPNMESIEYPQAFLFRTATNIARNNDKSQRRRHPERTVDVDTLEVPSDAPTPNRILEGEQELAVVRRALQELSPKSRRAFVMNRFENATYQDIAAELGVSVSMIEKYISQALAHLKLRLAEPRAASNVVRIVK